MKPRHALTNAQWAKIQPLLPKNPRGGRPFRLGDRMFLNAIIWRTKTGVSWRELDPRFGSWKTVYNRFRDWSLKRIWPALVKSMTLLKHEANSILDSTVVRAHQEAAGGKGGVKKTPSAGRRGASVKKSHALVDSRGTLRGLTLTQGIRHDSSCALPFVARAKGAAFIADKVYSGNTIITAVKAAEMKVFILTKNNARRPRKISQALYKKRIVGEHFFHRLKAYRAVATRYCMTGASFLFTISVACLARI